MIIKLELTEDDKIHILKWLGGYGFKANLAASIAQQGWISEKQRHHLKSADRTYERKYQGDYSGYGQDGGPDNAGNGYVSGY